MAALTTPHWEATMPGARDLLALLGQLSLLRPFYLAGGTALALRLGHRISQDLDLFANIETLDDHLLHSIVEELPSWQVRVEGNSRAWMVASASQTCYTLQNKNPRGQ